MGCIDNGTDFFVRDVVAKSVNAAKSADTVGDWRYKRRLRAASQRNRCADRRFFGKMVSKRGGFGCATKDQQTGSLVYRRQFVDSHLCVAQ